MIRSVVFVLAIGVPISSLWDESLVRKYCLAKWVTTGTIFSCDRRSENVNRIISLAKSELRFFNGDLRSPNLNISNLLNRKYHNLGVVLDAICLDLAKPLIQDKKYFYDTYHWLILSNESTKHSVIEFLENAPLNINSDVNLAVFGNNHIWDIWDIYNPASNHGGRLKITKFGRFTEDGGYDAGIGGSKYWSRKNMSGVQFKSAVVIPEDDLNLEEHLNSESDRKINSMHRFQSVTIDYCRQIYNFSLIIERTNSWGYLTPNGHFDGLVGLLEQRQIDFGNSPLIYKPDRMPVIDYSYGNWILKSTFIYRRPKAIEASYRIFLRPLSKSVWIAVMLTILTLIAFLKIIFSREKRLATEASLVDSSWSFLVLFTLGAFCQQGATCHPQLLSSRTLSVFVFLFCILIYQFYSASIVSYLLMDPPRRINNLQDLSDSGLDAGIEDILIDRNYFVQTTDPAAIGLFNKKIKGDSNDSGFYEPEEGLRRVKAGGFAFHVETSTAYPIIEETFSNQEICELEEVQMYRTQPMHTNLQKGSPFREMMNYCMLHLVEDGLMDRLRKFWDARQPICIESAKKIDIHVGIKEFLAGPTVLFYGMLSSFIFLLGEILLSKKRIWLGKRVIKPFTN